MHSELGSDQAFGKVVNGFKPRTLTVFEKGSILDALRSS